VSQRHNIHKRAVQTGLLHRTRNGLAYIRLAKTEKKSLPNHPVFRPFPSFKFTPLWLFQLCVLQLGSDENGDVSVCVFPERKEILIGCSGLRGVALHGVSAGEAEMGKSADGIQPNTATVGNFLELACGLAAFTRCQIGTRVTGPVLVGSKRFAPFPWGPRPPMKADISTLHKPDILILQRHAFPTRLPDTAFPTPPSRHVDLVDGET
jgi:hypothetical protein